MKTLIALSMLFLSGCSYFQVEPAKNFDENLAYNEAVAQASIKTLMDLTCEKYTPAGECTVSGRPLHPAVSKAHLETLGNVRNGIKAAGVMGEQGAGSCMDFKVESGAACLKLVQVALDGVREYLKGVK